MKKLDFIFDTDVGADCDDMMALTYLVYAKKHFNIVLKAVTHSRNDINGVPAIRAFFRTLGEDIPDIGRMSGELVEYKSYAKAIADRFCIEDDFSKCYDAVKVLRRALCNSEDAVLCAVGPFTNIAALLESGADEISELDGVSLVKARCSKVVVMAGQFVLNKSGELCPEWNVKCDVRAAKIIAEKCPVPLVFLPFETGEGIMTGIPIVERYGEATPLSMSFVKFGAVPSVGGRHSWDPATVVYAVEGVGECFEESPRGTVTVDEIGRTVMKYDDNGLHSILTVRSIDGESEHESKKRVASYIDACADEVYDNFSHRES